MSILTKGPTVRSTEDFVENLKFSKRRQYEEALAIESTIMTKWQCLSGLILPRDANINPSTKSISLRTMRKLNVICRGEIIADQTLLNYLTRALNQRWLTFPEIEKHA